MGQRIVAFPALMPRRVGGPSYCESHGLDPAVIKTLGLAFPSSRPLEPSIAPTSPALTALQPSGPPLPITFWQRTIVHFILEMADDNGERVARSGSLPVPVKVAASSRGSELDGNVVDPFASLASSANATTTRH